MRNVRSSI